MRVYRMELENGNGPFTGGNVQWSDSPNCGHRPGFNPAPDEDGLDGVLYPEVCVVRSFDEARTWFHPVHCFDLAEKGFYLAVYEAETEHVRHGGVQAVVMRNAMTLVERLPTTVICF